MKRLVILAILMFPFCISNLAKAGLPTVEVTGEATYYSDGRKSKDECKLLALEEARINALAKRFGTTVSQNISTSDRQNSHGTQSDFLLLTQTEVKGEWLGDIGEPKYDFSFDDNYNLIVKCTVKGMAREISNEAVDFEALLLRNGTQRAHADTHFRHEDDMYLLFNGAVGGYLSVFQEDESRNVYALLPYPDDKRGEVRLKGGKEYILFNKKAGNEECGPTREYYVTAPDHLEYNRLYVVYSPNPYSLPPMKDAGGIKTLSSSDFSKWLVRTRRNDSKMGVKTMNIEITPKN